MNRSVFIIAFCLFVPAVFVNAQDAIRVYLLGGQSNMLGRAYIPTTDPLLNNGLENGGIVPNDILYHHNFRGAETLADDGFTTLSPRPGDDGQIGNFGCELTFGRDMQLDWGLGEQIVILKYAVAGTTLYSDWYADGTGDQSSDGTHYQNFKSLVNEGLAKLQSDYPEANIQVEGMLWHQGESDRVNEGSYDYETNLTNFIHDVRQDLNVPNMPFCIGGLSDVETYYHQAAPAGMQRVIQAQKNVAAADPYSWFVSLDADDGMTIGPDEKHFSVDGYKVMGERFADVAMTPEPATMGLLLAGGLGFVLRRRSR